METINSKPLISLIVPIFNESSEIYQNLKTILAAAKDENIQLELIAVDDGSTDNTADIIHQLMDDNTHIHLIELTRNFGKEAAIHAGLKASQGDAVIIIDADLQHPPELIPQMIKLWCGGVLVVETIKSHRGKESWFNKLLSHSFYALFYLFTRLNIRGLCDFKLLDRHVVDSYLELPENSRFFRGLISWSGYPSARLPFVVAPRKGKGGSRWSRFRLLCYAIDNITALSSLPLRIVTWTGTFSLLFGLIIGSLSLWQKWQGVALDGFTTINLLIVIIGGTILMGLGIISHYLMRIYDEVKGRPAYLVKPQKREHK
ncbi:MAG: glycosyltransferase family 2 protein [Methylococcales bacterium]|nr:glycosyltransferase family 2 protein [Methylococcales bacterium]